jgi:AcrR family transcriptional regulator
MSETKLSSSRLRASPEPKPKITKSDRTRAAILDAALEFIWSRPFRDMTVNSLMATTDLSRSAFYQYFDDIHHLMETLLDMLAAEIFISVRPWLEGTGDPVQLMSEALDGLINTCYRQGPFLKAVSDAASTDTRFEKIWSQFLTGFDDAGAARIEADQAQGLIPELDARPVIFALNRLNAYGIIGAFGQRPRKQPEPLREAITRIWISTLYGAHWLEEGSSTLVRE